MDYIVKLEEIMEENNGFLTAEKVTKSNIPRIYLKEMVNRGIVTKLERGIYLKKGMKDDLLYRTQAKYGKIVYSHETALYLNHILKKEPQIISATINTGYNPNTIKSRGMKIYTIKEELCDYGLIEIPSKSGNMIRTYDLKRTICDLIRSRSHIDKKLMAQTLQDFVKKNPQEIDSLKEYAEKFRIAKILDNYLSVLIL